MHTAFNLMQFDYVYIFIYLFINFTTIHKID
jgi:hypothetical protein